MDAQMAGIAILSEKSRATNPENLHSQLSSRRPPNSICRLPYGVSFFGRKGNQTHLSQMRRTPPLFLRKDPRFRPLLTRCISTHPLIS